MELRSRRDPDTLFGAATGGAKTGRAELSRTFGWVSTTFSDVSHFRYDVEVADGSGDLAYTVGYETRQRVHRRPPGGADDCPGHPRLPPPNGEWKIVHRHGDSLPVHESPPVEASTT